MSNYSRTSKPQKETHKAKEKISNGVNAFHKGIAIIGSILGLITASITIYNFANSGKSKADTTNSSTPASTIIIKEGDTNTSTATSDTTNNADTNTDASTTTETNTDQSSANTTSSSLATQDTTTNTSSQTVTPSSSATDNTASNTTTSAE